MHCQLSSTVCTCTTCQRASFNSTTDSFSCCHDPYTLACKARPSFDRCGTSLSVIVIINLLISGSLKHTTTMLDDLTTGTRAHGLQVHPAKTQIVSTATSKRGNTVAVQGMNVEILPPERKIKYLGQLFTFKSAEQVAFEHRIKCAWVTFTSHR